MRPHIVTSNMPYKPTEKRPHEREVEGVLEERPARQMLAFQEKTVAFSWEKSEEIALVQFTAIFSELKKGEWPSFGAQHEYWDKAAEFVQKTVKTARRRSSKTY